MFIAVYNELGLPWHSKSRARGSAGVTASSIIRSALLLLLLVLLCSTALAVSPPNTEYRIPNTAAAAPAVLQSPFPKGGGLVPRQTGDFAATAALATADSAPNTGYRIPDTAPPILPQPVPASSIHSILDLAHASACRDAAKAIEEDNIAGALAMLDALVSGPFHWRGAVTNGFQQGFFVNALRGYCLERMGDIVKAYRSYQNSRACFDDEAVAVQCPEPRLEVFLGLGRTCERFGRLSDAEQYLLCCLSAAPTNSTLNTQARLSIARLLCFHGRPRKALGHFTMLEMERVPFDRDTWHCYAKSAFDCGEQVEGVRILLSALCAVGADARRCEEDPLLSDVRKYWLYFDDDDVLDFDAFMADEIHMQYSKGSERLLTYLINTRNLLAYVRSDIFAGNDDSLLLLSNSTASASAGSRAILKERLGPRQTSLATRQEQAAPSSYGDPQQHNLIEDRVNQLLVRHNDPAAALEGWMRLRDDFGDEALSKVPINGANAAFHCLAALAQRHLERATIATSPPPDVLATAPLEMRAANMYRQIVRCDTNSASMALLYLKQALAMTSDLHDLDALARVHLLMSKAHALLEPGDLSGKLDQLAKAQALAHDNRDLMLEISNERDQLRPLDLGELTDVVAQNGDNVPRRLRERLALMLYGADRNEEAFDAALSAIVCSPLVFVQDGALELLRSQQDYLTLAQLRQLGAVLRSSEMRIAPLLVNAPLYCMLRQIRRHPWLKLQTMLATMQEAHTYTQDDLVLLRRYALPGEAMVPIERAARLYMLATVYGGDSGVPLDWDVWLQWIYACQRKPTHIISMLTRAPTNNVARSVQEALSFYYTYQSRVDPSQWGVITQGLCALSCILSGRDCLQLSEYELAHARTGTAFAVALSHLRGMAPDIGLADLLLRHWADVDKNLGNLVLMVLDDNARRCADARWAGKAEEFKQKTKETAR